MCIKNIYIETELEIQKERKTLKDKINSKKFKELKEKFGKTWKEDNIKWLSNFGPNAEQKILKYKKLGDIIPTQFYLYAIERKENWSNGDYIYKHCSLFDTYEKAYNFIIELILEECENGYNNLIYHIEYINIDKPDEDLKIIVYFKDKTACPAFFTKEFTIKKFLYFIYPDQQFVNSKYIYKDNKEEAKIYEL